MAIASYNELSEAWRKLKALYTRDNKNLSREERIAWRELPRRRYIKLYRQIGHELYFPVWCFDSDFSDEKRLSTKLSYIDSWLTGDMVDEQNKIMDIINEKSIGSWIVEMKTWRGKWNTIIKLVEKFQQKTLIAVHNKKTLFELQEKFRKFSNYDPWLYFSGKKEIKDITIITHASLTKKYEEIKWKYWILIVDELDHWLSPSMIDAIIFSDIEWVWGFSWTPYRQELDTNDLTLIFWEHIKIEWQENNWYNIIPQIERIIFENKSVYSFVDFNDVKTQLINDKYRFWKQIEFIKEAHQNKKLWVILVDRVIECQLYFDALKDQWIPCAIINWQTKIKDDERNINEMIEQHGIIIWTSAKIGRWVDIPQIDSIYLFYPCRFQGNVVQSVGRWLRNFPGKDWITLYDWCDIPILKWQSYSRKLVYMLEYKWCNIKEILLK